MTDTITITTPGAPTGGTDLQGNPVLAAASSVASAGWYVAGFEGGEEDPADYGTTDVMRIVIYNRSVVTVPSNAAVTVRGRVWKVAGDTEPWVSPFGTGFAGTAVTLERAS